MQAIDISNNIQTTPEDHKYVDKNCFVIKIIFVTHPNLSIHGVVPWLDKYFQIAVNTIFLLMLLLIVICHSLEYHLWI